jgi:hypothetical protein
MHFSYFKCMRSICEVHDMLAQGNAVHVLLMCLSACYTSEQTGMKFGIGILY